MNNREIVLCDPVRIANAARQAGVAAGLPVSVPALTVNRVCGSGAQGIALALEML